jgi:predicted  nucleic acid-binding Zn-ribbon protein
MRIDERVENGRVVEQLSEDMKKLEKKHASLLEDVRNFMDTTGQRVMENNLGLIKGNSVQRRNELGELKKELDMLKNVQRTQAEVFKAKQKTLEDERDAIKEEKKKLEYIIYDMLQQKAAVEGSVKEKLQRIKDICDEP